MDKLNLSRHVFGYWSVLSRAPDYISPGGSHFTMWLCLCECGKIVAVNEGSLVRGKSKSCGHCGRMRQTETQEALDQNSKQKRQLLNKKNSERIGTQPRRHNTSGERNITRAGKSYRVAVRYNGKVHSKNCETMEEAIAVREFFRKLYWPGYKARQDTYNRRK